MFDITSTPVDRHRLLDRLQNPSAGALATFEGWVRNHHEGREVLRLEYEAYAELALKEGDRILEEARRKFSILDALCVHRTGRLAVGEIAVWVGVSAAHRQDAFAACQSIINQIKHRLPIWKKEYYANGESGWVNCEHCTKENLVSS